MTKAPSLTIGKLAQRTGCNVETIRYYERVGLIEEPLRTPGGHRQYGEAHARRLGFVRRARDLGFPLDTVRALLDLAQPEETECSKVEAVAAGHLGEVRAKIADLRRLEGVLAELAAQCQDGAVPPCPIIEALSGGGARDR